VFFFRLNNWTMLFFHLHLCWQCIPSGSFSFNRLNLMYRIWHFDRGEVGEGGGEKNARGSLGNEDNIFPSSTHFMNFSYVSIKWKIGLFNNTRYFWFSWWFFYLTVRFCNECGCCCLCFIFVVIVVITAFSPVMLWKSMTW